MFASPEDGFAALAADINAKISGNSRYLKANPTIAELGSVYAEDPNWPLSVSKILGVDPNTPTQLLPRDELIKAIMRQEGYFA